MAIRYRRRKPHPGRSGPRRKRRGPVPTRWSGVEVRVNGRRLEGVADVGWESSASDPAADIERAALGTFGTRNTYGQCDVHERTCAALAVALQGEVNEAMQREIDAWCEAHGVSRDRAPAFLSPGLVYQAGPLMRDGRFDP